MRKYFFLFLLFQPVFAYSESDNFIQTQDSGIFGGNRNQRILLYTKEECVSQLQRFYPLAANLNNGVKAISELNSTALMKNKSCVDNLLKDWDQLNPPPVVKSSNQQAEEQYVETWKAPVFDRTPMKAIEEAMNCYNMFMPGTQDFKNVESSRPYCKDKWVDKSTYDQAKANYEQERQKERYFNAYNDFRKGWNRYLQEIFKKPYPEKPPSLTELNKIIKCYNPYPENTQNYNWHKSDHQSLCTDFSSTKEEAVAATVKLNEENAKFYKEYQEIQRENGQLESALRAKSLVEKIDKEKFVGFLEKYLCSFPSDSKESQEDHKYRYKGLCKDSFAPYSNRTKLMEEFKTDLDQTRAALDIALEKKKQAEKERLASIESALGVYEQQYALRRLLLFHNYYQNHGGNLLDLDSFCGKLEKQQATEKQFAKSGNSIILFTQEKHWRLAKDYGLSEAEYSAILSYTGNFYKTINPAIWHKELDEKLLKFKEVMDNGMRQLPSFNEKKVTRFSELPNNIAAEHEENKIVCYDAYTSTSKKSDFKWHGSFEFHITPGDKGRQAFLISGHTEEEEVLFDSGTCFKVTSVTKEKGKTIIEMTEVDGNKKVIGKIKKP